MGGCRGPFATPKRPESEHPCGFGLKASQMRRTAYKNDGEPHRHSLSGRFAHRSMFSPTNGPLTMNNQNTINLRALPGCTATPTFEHLPALDYTLIRLPASNAVLEVQRNGFPVKFRQDGRHLMVYPGFRLEGDRVTVIFQESPQEPRKVPQATTPPAHRRLARRRPSEALPAASVRQP